MTTDGWKSRSNRVSRRKSCLTCHFSHKNSPMDCSGIKGGPLQLNCMPESLWCTPIRNYSNFWSACTVLSAIRRRGVSDVSTKFISSVTLGDPSVISHRASGPAALCRPISWESAVPFFIAITRHTSGLRISRVLFSTVVSRRTQVRLRLRYHATLRTEANRTKKIYVLTALRILYSVTWRRVKIYIGFEGTCHFHLQDKFESEDWSCRDMRKVG